MKFSIIIFSCLIVAGLIFASGKHDHKHGEKKEGKNEKVQVKGTQKNCPVTGKKIDGKSFIYFQGQKIGLCCMGMKCDEKLLKDPEGGFKELHDKSEMVDNVQTKCPVSGDKLDDYSTKISLAARNVYVCCKDCIKEFKLNPKKFLNKMDDPKSPEKKEAHKHGDHSH